MATKILSNEFMQKIMNEEAWKKLSNNFNWSETLLEKYQDKVDWHELSQNSDVSLSFDLLDKYADLWDWEEIIDRYGDQLFEGQGIEFYERYKEQIPISKIQNSRLWYEIVSQQMHQLIAEITA